MSELDPKLFLEHIEIKRAIVRGLQALEVDLLELAKGRVIRSPAVNARWYKEVRLPYEALRAKYLK